MTRPSAFLLALALLLVVAALPRETRSGTGSPHEVLFAPTGDKRLIERAIKEQLKTARRTIRLAVYQFTSPNLAQILKSADDNARIRVLFDAEQARYLRDHSMSTELEGNKRIEIRFVDLPGKGSRAAKFHHKFCVIDDHTVLTGSYNWTVLADEENHENFLILRDQVLAAKYTEQFDAIWNDPKITSEDLHAGSARDPDEE